MNLFPDLHRWVLVNDDNDILWRAADRRAVEILHERFRAAWPGEDFRIVDSWGIQ